LHGRKGRVRVIVGLISFVDRFLPESRMSLDFEGTDPATARAPLTVSALNRAIAGLLERSFPLVRVRGEIANLTRAASGHWYFVLKDDAAQVRCVMFRSRNQLLDWAPRDGDDVELSGLVSLYEARGDFQLNVEFMRRAGQGRLFEEFLRVKARLAAEGLFASEAKRALPHVPRRIGVITSLQAAALRDVLTTLSRRAPYVDVVVYPVPVQGAGAGSRIAAMLDTVSRRNEVDVVLLVRGGGSIEDLWSFNEEAVARSIRACALPVVVGVGHESDFTIADFAADARAPTPTAAAELVAPDQGALRDTVRARLLALCHCLARKGAQAQQRLDYAARALATPRAPLQPLANRVEALAARAARLTLARLAIAREHSSATLQRLARGRPSPRLLAAGLESRLARLRSDVVAQAASRRARVESNSISLGLLDPRQVLERGYSIVRSAAGELVRNADALAAGDELRIDFARGGADVRIEKLRRS
jgi:exodeoxyribonuclease VII large subunit